MKKKYMIIAILLMVVGFATVSTVLYINGSTNIKANDGDFNVYYSFAKVNGVQSLSVIESDTKISFNTTLDTLGQQYVLEYEVTNGSKNYDADLTMVCTSGDNYLSVVNSFDDTTNLEALGTRTGTLTLTLNKTYTGEDYNVDIECTIKADAVERTSLASGPMDPVDFCESKGYSSGRLNPSYTALVRPDETEEGDLSAAYYLCEVETETTFDVYGYTLEGDLVYTYKSEF